MANSIDVRITEEGPRNAVVKITGVLDTTDADLDPVITLGMFGNNDKGMILTGFRLDLVEYSISQGLEVVLYWMSNAGTPASQPILPLAGRGRIDAHNYGGFSPDMTVPGYNGGIELDTKGYQPGTLQTFTVVLELVKLYKV